MNAVIGKFISMKNAASVTLCIICTIFNFSCKSVSGDDDPFAYDEQLVSWANNKYENKTLCIDDLCLYYQQVWKEFFLEETGFTEDFFNNHIEVFSTELMEEYNEWTVFYVQYKIKCDWANTYEMDFFHVKVKKGILKYELLPEIEEYMYVDTYLKKEEMISVYPDSYNGKIAFSIWDAKIPDYENLKFDSFKSAMNYFKRETGVNVLYQFRIEIDPKIGAWVLYTLTKFEPESAQCIWGKLNLNTGEIIIHKGSCDYN